MVDRSAFKQELEDKGLKLIGEVFDDPEGGGKLNIFIDKDESTRLVAAKDLKNEYDELGITLNFIYLSDRDRRQEDLIKNQLMTKHEGYLRDIYLSGNKKQERRFGLFQQNIFLKALKMKYALMQRWLSVFLMLLPIKCTSPVKRTLLSGS